MVDYQTNDNEPVHFLQPYSMDENGQPLPHVVEALELNTNDQDISLVIQEHPRTFANVGVS